MSLLRTHAYCNITPSSRRLPSPACSSCSRISILASQTATNSAVLTALLPVLCSSHPQLRRLPAQLVSVFSFANTAPNTSFIGIMQHDYQCNMVVDLGCGGALRTAEWELIKNCAFIRTASTAHATNLMGGARRICGESTSTPSDAVNGGLELSQVASSDEDAVHLPYPILHF